MEQWAGAVLDSAGLDHLIGALRRRGFRVVGPVVRDGAVMAGELRCVADLPVGRHDRQEPGHYQLTDPSDEEVFGWAVGPRPWRAELFPPVSELWRARRRDDGVDFEEPASDAGGPMAVFGARPCDLAALSVLDTVLAHPAVPDPAYRDARSSTFVVAVECGTPGGTCFCTSVGSGPGATGGFDLCLTELDDDRGHRFLVRTGSAAGQTVLAEAGGATPAGPEDLVAREAVLARAADRMGRRLDTDDLPALLARSQDSPLWAEVAERCLSCGNCTLVCPTCFCSSFEDTTDLAGTVTRRRRWASCFEADHSYIHGGPVRASVSSRYRQWMTHKLSTWVDQYGTSGCVGCGRCVTWCPAGIDITAEAAALRARAGIRP